MVSSYILINGSVPPLLTASSGSTLTLTNQSDIGVTAWLWEIVDRPTGSTASLSSSSAPTTSIILDKEGSYLFRLTVNGGGNSYSSTAIAAVPTYMSSIRLPAAYERTEADQDRGWVPAINDALLKNEKSSHSGVVISAMSNMAIPTGSPVCISGVGTSPSGEIIPEVTLALANDLIKLPAIGVTITPAVGPAQQIKVRMSGALSELYVNTSTASGVNAPVYVSDTGTLSFVQGTNANVIGYVETVSINGKIFILSAGQGSGSSTSKSGIIYITDIAVQGSGAVSNKVWVDSPTNTILESCTSSSQDIIVSIKSSYPKVVVNGTSATLPVVNGIYIGTVNITQSVSGDVEATIDVTNGASSTTVVTLDTPPQILTLEFAGDYPGTQTELKAGDTFQITGTTDKPSVGVEVLDYGACIVQTFTFTSNTTFTVTGTIANRGTTAQLLPARVRARNAAGAYGSTRDTNTGGGTTEKVHVIKLNNLYPTVTFGAITYPGSQQALKDSEQASVGVTLSDLDSVSFTSPNGDLSISNPTLIEGTKTVTRIGGTYNISTNNLRATATRTANDTQTVQNSQVKIAHVAAAITVATPAARLRSGGNNSTSIQNHVITMTSNQQLLSTPTLNADTGGGTFTGSWSGGPTSYTRTLQVHDNDVKNTYTWQSLSATNLAGIVTNTITTGSTYVLGGFVARNLVFSAFSQTTTLGVAVVTYSKLTAGVFTATNQPALRNATQGNHSNIVNTYTVDSIGTNPTTLFWNDQTAASTNTQGTAQITNVEETV